MKGLEIGVFVLTVIALVLACVALALALCRKDRAPLCTSGACTYGECCWDQNGGP